MSNEMPLTHRSRDSFYVLFLIHYISVIVFFDSVSLYPSSIVPESLLSLHAWYKEHFNDQIVINQPAWFRFFFLTEILYQLPVGIWGIWALRSKSYKAPVHLLVWALVCCGTTITCMFEFYHNESMSGREKVILIGMYGLYGVTYGIMCVDMFCRIHKILEAAAGAGGGKKRR